MVEYYLLMYDNRRMRPVETIPGRKEEGMRERDREIK
jgi:hypothetical protein